MATDEHKGGPWWLPLAMAAFSLLASAYVGYAGNDKAIAERVVKVEVLQEGVNPRLDKIEAKLDRIVEVERKLDRAEDKLDKMLSIIVKELQ